MRDGGAVLRGLAELFDRPAPVDGFLDAAVFTAGAFLTAAGVVITVMLPTGEMTRLRPVAWLPPPNRVESALTPGRPDIRQSIWLAPCSATS